MLIIFYNLMYLKLFKFFLYIYKCDKIFNLFIKNENKLSNILNKTNVSDLPESFDARTKWPKCNSIGRVYDENACSASWVNLIKLE